ncbi:MAG: hypothetical protein K0U45_10180 [Alphaproteobacteria bacterium]|nr:hypothetical protein [Alphaproteobacteria bacterium]
MTKYSFNNAMDLKTENKRALLTLRSKETLHQISNKPIINEGIDYTPPKYKNKEATLLKNQLNDCRDTLVAWQKGSKTKNVGKDAQKALTLLDNVLKQMAGANIIKEDFSINHRMRAFGGKVKASIRAIISHETDLCAPQKDYNAKNYNAQNYMQSILNVDFSHIKRFEKQRQCNTAKHQLIIETAA